MHLRDLQFPDIFRMSRIFKKLQIKEKIKEIVSDHKGNVKDKKLTPEEIMKEQEQLGVDLMFTVVENLSQAEEEVTEFLADVAGMSKEEFKKLTLQESMQIVTALFQKDGVMSFFKLAGQLTK